MKTLAVAVAVIAGTAVCAHAQQPVTAFDGTYLGMGLTASAECKVPTGAFRRPLTITAGAAEFNGGMNGDLHYQGTMTANGYVMLRSGDGRIINVKIEPSGRAIGGFAGIFCSATLVWQKQGQH